MAEQNARKAARPSKPRGEEIRRECMAYGVGACGETGVCLECGPIHQAMRAAGWALTRWPRVKGSRRA